jgi:hypothetical protein
MFQPQTRVFEMVENFLSDGVIAIETDGFQFDILGAWWLR